MKRILTWNTTLIVITENMVIGQFKMEGNGSVQEISRVKLSTRFVIVTHHRLIGPPMCSRDA